MEACLSQLKKWLLQLLLEFLDLILPDAPNVLLSISQIVFGLSSDVDFIGSALLLDQKADLHEDLMELFCGVDLLAIFFKDKYSLILVKGEI